MNTRIINKNGGSIKLSRMDGGSCLTVRFYAAETCNGHPVTRRVMVSWFNGLLTRWEAYNNAEPQQLGWDEFGSKKDFWAAIRREIDASGGWRHVRGCF